MAEAFDSISQLDESAKIGGPCYFAFHHVASFVSAKPISPNVFDLFDPEGKPAVLRIHLEDSRLNCVSFLELLARVLDAFSPTYVADVDQSFHAFFNLHERAKIG